MKFSNQKKLDILCRKNAAEVTNHYFERYFDHR